MNFESFVYAHINLTDGRTYIGKHKGTESDGYVCSSHSDEFWADYNNPNKEWTREILFRGTDDECLDYEHNILKEAASMDITYNNNTTRGIVMTTEVRNKISVANTGNKKSPEDVQGIRNRLDLAKLHSPEAKVKRKRVLIEKGVNTLTSEDAADIRDSYSTMLQTELAEKYGVSVSCISQVINNKLHIDSNYTPPSGRRRSTYVKQMG